MPENQDQDPTGGLRFCRPDDPLTKIRLTRRAAFIGAAAFAIISGGLTLAYAETGDLPLWSGAVGSSISAVVLLSRGAGLSGQAAQLETALDTRRAVGALRREDSLLRAELTGQVADLTEEVRASRQEAAELREMISEGFAAANENVAAVDRRLAAAEDCVRTRLDDVVKLEVASSRAITAVAGSDLSKRRNGTGERV